jgi:hypothetical protein
VAGVGGAAGAETAATAQSGVAPGRCTGPGTWENNRTLHDLLGESAEFHGFVPPWGPLFWELGQHSADSLLESGDAWQQVLAVLRAEGDEAVAFERVYVEALRRLEALAGRDHVRWCDLMRIILSWGIARRPPEERPALEAAERAALADVHRQNEVAVMARTIGQTIWEEGLSRGELQASRRMLRQFLTARFGPLAEDVVQRIETCTDLDRLTAAAQQVATLDKPENLRL